MDLSRGKEVANVGSSLRQRRRLHLHPTPARRRPEPLRASLGALEPDPERREDFDQCDEHDRRAERRESRERGCC